MKNETEGNFFGCGISESDIENQTDIRNTGASEVLKNGYKV